MKHISVLLDEAISLLEIKEDGSYMDGTLGRGGHTKKILESLNDKGRVIVFDLDSEAIEETKSYLKDDRVEYHHANFATFSEYVKPQSLDGILLDLGVSSPQFDDPKRGFSYRFDATLDMRMDEDAELDAHKVVNEYSEEELVRILKDYGEEPYAKRIARSIVKRRSERPIDTTFELVDVIKEAYPIKALSKKGHPAKQTFQAIRIEVNKELSSLEKFLSEFPRFLKKGGTCVIITFHSLEDRLVKRRFKELSEVKVDKRIALRPEEIKRADFSLINHKAMIASAEEIDMNSRAKSAKVRGIRKEV